MMDDEVWTGDDATDDALSRVYEDRNRLVLLAFSLALEASLETYIIDDPAEPDWPVLAIELPTGQVSWHVPRALLRGHESAGLRGEWDGHSKEDAAKRLLAWVFRPDDRGKEVARWEF